MSEENRYRKRQVKFRLTEEEYEELAQRAELNQMSIAKYIRVAIFNTDGKPVPVIDIAPLKEMAYELKKQGANLNQLMKFLNKYGIKDYNTEAVRKVVDLEAAMSIRLFNIFGDLREEAAKYRVNILDSSDMKQWLKGLFLEG